MINQPRQAVPLSKADALRRLTFMKRGVAAATVLAFGAFGVLAFPRGTSAAPNTTAQTPAATPMAGQSGGSATSPSSGSGGNTPYNGNGGNTPYDGNGGNAPSTGGGFFNGGQGGYGFGPGNTYGGPATSSGVS